MHDAPRSYRSQEFAQLAGVTVKALRHYDRSGLLKPKRNAAGYRIYSAHDLGRVQQILTLKLIGLTLAQIRQVLGRGPKDLAEVLAAQCTALEVRRQSLERVIAAIKQAQGELAAGRPAVLEKLIEVIQMEINLDALKQYYQDDATWEAAKGRLRSGPTEERKILLGDIEAAIARGEDPEGAAAEALATRWLDLEPTDAALQAGGVKAWADRANWPQELRARFGAGFDIEAIWAFIGRAISALRKKYYSEQAWGELANRTPEQRQLAAAEWLQLISEVNGSVQEDPAGERAQELLRRWLVLAGSVGIREGSARAWRDRENWPEAMKRQMAALHVDQAAAFMGRVIAAQREK